VKLLAEAFGREALWRIGVHSDSQRRAGGVPVSSGEMGVASSLGFYKQRMSAPGTLPAPNDRAEDATARAEG